jgi:hypothetical protein
MLEMFEEKTLKFLIEMVGACNVEYKYGSSIKFSKEIGGRTFVLQVDIQDNNYKHVALTNIVLLPSMKRKGVSIAIINFLLQLCNENEYDLYITEITNDLWKDGLVKFGGVIDNYGDIAIIQQDWKPVNHYKLLKFVEFEDELILDSELEWYSNLKKQCIVEIKNIFKSWNAEIENDIIDEKVNQITAIKDNETYLAIFRYLYIIKMDELIKNNQLEDYIKKNQYIGSLL